MPRLYRPTIPVEVKCRVVLRQLGEMFIDDVIRAHRFVPRETVHRRSHARLLVEKLAALARLLKCKVSDLRLDHDPPLGARPQFRRGLGKKTYYEPDANDPHHLFYRPHGPEFEGSHLIKTNVRGDHGQHPDRVLIKRERRRQKREEMHSLEIVAGKPKPRTRKSFHRPKVSGFPKRPAQVKHTTDSGSKVRPPKRKWASRPLTSCARGARCHCKSDPARWARRKEACGNWRTVKIGGEKRW